MKHATATILLAGLLAQVPYAAAKTYLATNVACGDSVTCPLNCLGGAFRVVTDTNSSTSFFGCTLDGLDVYDVSRCIYVGAGSDAEKDAVEEAACAGAGGRLCGTSTKYTTLNCVYPGSQTAAYNTACVNAVTAVNGRLGRSANYEAGVTYAVAFDYADCTD